MPGNSQSTTDSHRRQHQKQQLQQDANRRRQSCEMVNKIASIDIWATERLYNRWHRQALADLAERQQDSNNPPLESLPQNASGEQQPLFNYNASQPLCKRHRNSDGGGSGGGGGVKYFMASVVNQPQPCNNDAAAKRTKPTEGDAPEPADELRHRHRCRRRLLAQQKQQEQEQQQRTRRAHSRPDECRQQQHRQHNRHEHHHHNHQRRHLSLSNACQPGAPREQERESQRTSEIDWPDSWPSIWGSSAPKCISLKQQEQQQQQQRQRKEQKQSGGKDQPRQTTVEALLTFNPSNMMGSKNNAAVSQLAKLSKNQHRDGGHNSLAIRRNEAAAKLAAKLRSRLEKPTTSSLSSTLSSSSSVSGDKSSGGDRSMRSHSVDGSTYTIIKKIIASATTRQANQAASRKRTDHESGNFQHESALARREYNVARLCKTEKRQAEQAEMMPKPVVWLIADQSMQESVASSEREVNTAVLMKSAATDRRRRASKERASKYATRRRKKQALALQTLACHNSTTDGKSLRMLSSTTNEFCDNAYDSEAQADETEYNDEVGPKYSVALISSVRPLTRFKRAVCQHRPEIRFQSNTASTSTTAKNGTGNNEMLPESVDNIFHTYQEFGESKGVEPKTGSVTRYVQDAVLSAAKLVAARGFAGLVGARPSELNVDTTNTDTVTDEEEEQDDVMGGNRDSLSTLDDLEDFEEDDEEVKESSGLPSEDSVIFRTAGTSSTIEEEPKRRKKKVRSSGREKQKKFSGESGDEGDFDNQRGGATKRQGKADPPQPKKLLPMTQCPTTQHRIECYRTKAGRVKCYMTARHPVKCRVQDGRIVCKATVNAESSNLPYPCNAAWQ